MSEMPEGAKAPATAPASAAAPPGAPAVGAAAARSDGGDQTSKDYYFDSYAHFSIHEEMLKDEVRTCSYRDAIMENAAQFEGKVVMDVGCGTGVLSMFAARAGAAHVIAIECSGIAKQARQIIADNGFADRITLLNCKVEDVGELPGGIEKVDIIISEWMGYFLLYESMLDTVIYARDRWLAEGGLLLPDQATLYVAALEDGEYMAEKIGYWDNVYGFNMRAIKEIAMLEPLVDTVEGAAVISNAVPVLHLDLMSCTVADLRFGAAFELTFARNDNCHAIISYFDCGFTRLRRPVVFTTSPLAPYTHWKQTVFYLEAPITACKGERINGQIECAPNAKNPRDLDIDIALSFRGSVSQLDAKQEYRLR